ncbi:MAG: carbamoyl-phosphate synthase large subunit [Planctomycetes bacterium]|nr:carbamoyl-phosphate synthase large subunit [Planctomycetota bacterium]
MPKRTDIHKIMIVGAGPIIIGQACEFDYSGTQACKALQQEGYEVVLLNSNPATIMTDPQMASRIYIEPITVEMVERIIEREKPDALLPTLGGQTALNVAVAAHDAGILQKHGVELIGASADVIKKAEDRELFKAAMDEIGLESLRSVLVHNKAEAMKAAGDLGLPIIIRPSFTLGGTGGSAAYNIEEFEELVQLGLELSPVHSVLLEESAEGWKEFELEVMRDRADNVVIVCTIENLDPMGVHTGDSITVAPIQTLTDREYQRMRDASVAIIRAIGVETGGCNIQFAVHPETGRMIVIEMNPRVSRSSALASKATGFPIAKMAAKLAVGYTLDEIPNDITEKTPACFEPTIDYCVVKIPRFTFEKFPGSDPTLTIQMKSVGEAMSIGRTFKEAFQKGLRSMEIKRMGFGADGRDADPATIDDAELRSKLITPNGDRIYYIRYAFERGWSVEDLHEMTRIDPWFLDQMEQLVEAERRLADLGRSGGEIDAPTLREAKALGYSDVQLAHLLGKTEVEIRHLRWRLKVEPVYKLVDTCAAEFEAYTPYYYSTYEADVEDAPSHAPRIMILGGGPNRIGQGIEFDYCCVHASMALQASGYQSIMVNCNPETVSTDYDASDRLYFEPLTHEDVLAIVRREQPDGVIVQFGGQTPLNLSEGLQCEGVPILGTSPDSIARAEDRGSFAAMIEKLGLRQPPNGMAATPEEARKIAARLGYPVIVRPSFVLGGRAMEIVYDDEQLDRFAANAVAVSDGAAILVDKYLEEATEIDVDAVADGRSVYIAGIMEHVEPAGVHSGDAAMVLPPQWLSSQVLEDLRLATRAMALELNVRGLMNVQFAVTRDQKVYVLEVNPRASRTVPFVSKVTGVPIAKVATRIMLGETLEKLGLGEGSAPLGHVGVKESVFPFNRFRGVDCVLGPEMHSTGEVMGIDIQFGMAFAKSQLAAGMKLPTSGNVLVSLMDADKEEFLESAERLVEMGFTLLATDNTHAFFQQCDVPSKRINKVREGRPHILDAVKNHEIQLIINTPSGKTPRADEVSIRTQAVSENVPLVTTVMAAKSVVTAIAALQAKRPEARTIQEYNADSPFADM